jgi:hypothetical protein
MSYNLRMTCVFYIQQQCVLCVQMLHNLNQHLMISEQLVSD